MDNPQKTEYRSTLLGTEKYEHGLGTSSLKRRRTRLFEKHYKKI